jgi:chromosome segregation ATPase
MPTNTDLELDETPETGNGDSSNESSAPKSPNTDWKYWKNRFEGNTKTINRLQAKLNALEGQLASLEDEYSGKLSALTTQATTHEKQAKDAAERLAAAQKAAEELERKVASMNAAREQAKVIREKYPSLIDAYENGDLKSQSDFEKPEDYEAYLERMHKRMAPPEPAPEPTKSKGPAKGERAAAATPGIAARRVSGEAKRTRDEIANEMWALDTRDPEQDKRFRELQTELFGLQEDVFEGSSFDLFEREV